MATLRAIVFAVLAVLLAAGSAFFAFYTARLAYVKQRHSGMCMGGTAFPVASTVFADLSLRFAKLAVSASRPQP